MGLFCWKELINGGIKKVKQEAEDKLSLKIKVFKFLKHKKTQSYTTSKTAHIRFSGFYNIVHKNSLEVNTHIVLDFVRKVKIQKNKEIHSR